MKPADLLRRLNRLAIRQGWDYAERDGRGSHVIVRLNGRTTVVARHPGDMPAGTLRKVLKDLGLTGQDLEV